MTRIATAMTSVGLGVILLAACGTDGVEPQKHEVVPCVPATTGNRTPTYTELFETYFAPGKPGHCATAGCHADPGHDTWLCGDTKESCYRGMVQVGLIDPDDLAHSMIADSVRSPLAWVAPSGNMPFDAPTPFPAGGDAIVSWVAACAPND